MVYWVGRENRVNVLLVTPNKYGCDICQKSATHMVRPQEHGQVAQTGYEKSFRVGLHPDIWHYGCEDHDFVEPD